VSPVGSRIVFAGSSGLRRGAGRPTLARRSPSAWVSVLRRLRASCTVSRVTGPQAPCPG